jgi:hypothetical protein
MNCCRCLPVVGKGLVGSLAAGARRGLPSNACREDARELAAGFASLNRGRTRP